MEATQIITAIQRTRSESEILRLSFAKYGMYASAEIWQSVTDVLTRILREVGAE